MFQAAISAGCPSEAGCSCTDHRSNRSGRSSVCPPATNGRGPPLAMHSFQLNPDDSISLAGSCSIGAPSSSLKGGRQTAVVGQTPSTASTLLMSNGGTVVYQCPHHLVQPQHQHRGQFNSSASFIGTPRARTGRKPNKQPTRVLNAIMPHNVKY